MKKSAFLFLMFFLFQNAFSQEFEMVRHQVKLGETVRMLSKKYKVEPAEIYRLNKFAIDGIREGMVLQILVPKKEEIIVDAHVGDEDVPPVVEPADPQPTESVAAPEVREVTHTVAKGETLYSLSKKYNVSVDDLKAWNETLQTKGLQTGQVLVIRTGN
jgi:LysM repeat protein